VGVCKFVRFCVYVVCVRVRVYLFIIAAAAPAGVVASGSFDHTLRLWDAANGGSKGVLAGHAGEVVALVWAHDGRRLASASMDKTVAVWDAGRGVRTAALSPPSAREVSCVDAAAWSPDVFLSGDMGGAALLWDARAPGAPSCVLGSRGGRAHSGALAAAVLSPRPEHVLTGGGDGAVALWDVRAPPAPVAVIANFRGEATCAVFSASGGAVCAGGADGRVVYAAVSSASASDAASAAAAVCDRGRQHNGSVSCVAFNYAGTAYASSGADGCARVYAVVGPVESPPPPQILAGPHGSDVFRVAFSYAGDQVVTAATDTTVAVWRAPPLREQHGGK
jgi:WD40 repeat protein